MEVILPFFRPLTRLKRSALVAHVILGLPISWVCLHFQASIPWRSLWYWRYPWRSFDRWCLWHWRSSWRFVDRSGDVIPALLWQVTLHLLLEHLSEALLCCTLADEFPETPNFLTQNNSILMAALAPDNFDRLTSVMVGLPFRQGYPLVQW